MVVIADRDELKRRLEEKSKKARAKADEILASELVAIQGASRADLEALRPKVSDPTTYAELLKIVEASTKRNENVAQLQDRLKKAGKAMVSLAKEAAGLLTHG